MNSLSRFEVVVVGVELVRGRLRAVRLGADRGRGPWRRPRRRLRRLRLLGVGSRDGPPGPPGSLRRPPGTRAIRCRARVRWAGRTIRRSGGSLGAEPRVERLEGARGGGRSRVRRPGCEAGCVRGANHSGARRRGPARARAGRSARATDRRSTSRSRSAGARPGRSATWPGGGGAIEAGGRGRSGWAGRSPPRDRIAAGHRGAGPLRTAFPRPRVQNPRAKGGGSARAGARSVRGSCVQARRSAATARAAATAGCADRLDRGPRPAGGSRSSPSPNEGSRRVSRFGNLRRIGREPRRRGVPCARVRAGRAGGGGLIRWVRLGGQVGLEWLRRPGRQPADLLGLVLP